MILLLSSNMKICILVFCDIQECFHAAKMAFRRYRSKVQTLLADTHTGLEPLSEAVQGYINKNGTLLDVHTIVEVSHLQEIFQKLEYHFMYVILFSDQEICCEPRFILGATMPVTHLGGSGA